jgi:hypothetical protein
MDRYISAGKVLITRELADCRLFRCCKQGTMPAQSMSVIAILKQLGDAGCGPSYRSSALLLS